MELAITLTRITFPFLLFISLASFFSAILNSHNKFAIASAAPIILNILLIGVLIVWKNFKRSIGILPVLCSNYLRNITMMIIFLYLFCKKVFFP